MTIPTTLPVTPTIWKQVVDNLNGFTPSGTFHSPYKFLIITDGVDTYAVNAYQIVYGGPSNVGGVDGGDPCAVIQAALDNLTSGRTSKETVAISGTYDLGYGGTNTHTGYGGFVYNVKHCIDVHSYTTLDLTDAKLASSTITMDDGIINIDDESDVDIFGGEIQGGLADNRQNFGIYVLNSHDINIDGCYIHGTKTGQQGINIAGDDATGATMSYNVNVRNCKFDNIGDYCIYIGHSHDCKVIGNTMRSVRKGVVSAWNSYQNKIALNTIDTTTDLGINLENNTYFNTVSENTLINVGSGGSVDAIILNGGAYLNNIINNTIVAPTKSGIRLYNYTVTVPTERGYTTCGATELNLIANNVIRAPGVYGVHFAADGSGNRTQFNQFINNFISSPGVKGGFEEVTNTGIVNYNQIHSNTIVNNSTITLVGVNSSDTGNYQY